MSQETKEELIAPGIFITDYRNEGNRNNQNNNFFNQQNQQHHHQQQSQQHNQNLADPVDVSCVDLNQLLFDFSVLSNSIDHLQLSNAELIECLTADPHDSEYQLALNENQQLLTRKQQQQHKLQQLMDDMLKGRALINSFIQRERNTISDNSMFEVEDSEDEKKQSESLESAANESSGLSL